ncbi:putative Shwachman-Bodian-diamond syndrome protein [Protomyces lactucae-debilis]|uniref:Ribosome maturation protein SDO1 n=1 Tax=Protomyces lactucae-debilis TaxID=2754530 RepID=A0A1Y2FFI3_PROLT|nr:putative Shwachman-Bodian-diamond syndrome protein [Protomyces lactucae-debilis]ORY82693.1 putative Shwachman-Bodian-diamond syndrome protein [Protomyces lactucae-debilis]
MPINQPSNQIKLTNVSVVRYKRSGKRFELAAYKNKVLEWRAGTEKDIDEVLQIDSIFANVSKGAVASNDDIKKAFGEKPKEDIIQEILKKGELQVGDKERGAMTENTFKDIVQIICDKTVDPTSKRPYTAGMIEKALHDLGFSTSTNKPAKSQALDAIKQLQAAKTLPITRALMKIRITCTAKEGKLVREQLRALFESLEEDSVSAELEMVGSVQPGSFRAIGDLIREHTRGKGQIEVLNFSQSTEGDESWN